MTKNLRKIICLLLSFVMVLSTAACGSDADAASGKDSDSQVTDSAAADSGVAGTEESGSGDSEETDEIVTIMAEGNLFTGLAEYPWFDEFFKENFGIEVRSVGIGASFGMTLTDLPEELPDVWLIDSRDLMMQGVEAGAWLDFKTAQNKMPALFTQEVYETANKYTSYLYTGDTEGSLYGAPYSVGDLNKISEDMQIRWDLYEAAGAPMIECWDDMLDLWQTMMELEPATAAGDKCYAYGMYGHEDGAADFYGLLGYDTYGVGAVTMRLADWSGEPRYAFEDDSPYYEALTFLNAAYQKGLIDPEFTSMDYDTYYNHASGGRYHWLNNTWFNSFNQLEGNPEAGIGQMSIQPRIGFAVQKKDVASTAGRNRWYVINAESEHIDEACAWLNFCLSYEGARFIADGPEGMYWEYDADGNRVYTAEAIAAKANGESYVIEGGGTDYYAMACFSECMTVYNIVPEEGKPISIDAEYLGAAFGEDPILTANWKTTTGLNHVTDMFKEDSGYNWIQKTEIADFMPPSSDEYVGKWNSTETGIYALTRSMITDCKTEAELQAKWDEVQQLAEDAGLQEVHEYNISLMEAAAETAALFGITK